MDYQMIEKIKLKDNLIIEVTFYSGVVKAFDVKSLFEKYPEYKILATDKELWNKAEILPQGSGIYFNDDLDLTPEELWQNGKLLSKEKVIARYRIAQSLFSMREKRNITQKQLSSMTGISQCDISRIEGGVANPTVDTLAKICEALKLEIKIETRE